MPDFNIELSESMTKRDGQTEKFCLLIKGKSIAGIA